MSLTLASFCWSFSSILKAVGESRRAICNANHKRQRQWVYTNNQDRGTICPDTVNHQKLPHKQTEVKSIFPHLPKSVSHHEVFNPQGTCLVIFKKPQHPGKTTFATQISEDKEKDKHVTGWHFIKIKQSKSLDPERLFHFEFAPSTGSKRGVIQPEGSEIYPQWHVQMTLLYHHCWVTQLQGGWPQSVSISLSVLQRWMWAQ